MCRLDSIVTVVDALRLQSEFACGDSLVKENIDEEEIENLIIQQIEFCNIIVLNKVSEIGANELHRIKEIIRALQPHAKIIESDYTRVDLQQLLDTHGFDFDKVSLSAAWVQEFDRAATLEEEEEARHHHHHHEHEHEHEHHHHEHECDNPDCTCHHHHHHEHEGGEVEEYGIGTFVYYRRRPFNFDKFNTFVTSKWNRNIIRSKGVCYFGQNPDMSYLFEQAGVQKKLVEAGQWFCTAPEEELNAMVARDPSIMRDWDEVYGDRMQKIVFIGQKMEQKAIVAALDDCLE